MTESNINLLIVYIPIAVIWIVFGAIVISQSRSSSTNSQTHTIATATKKTIWDKIKRASVFIGAVAALY